MSFFLLSKLRSNWNLQSVLKSTSVFEADDSSSTDKTLGLRRIRRARVGAFSHEQFTTLQLETELNLWPNDLDRPDALL